MVKVQTSASKYYNFDDLYNRILNDIEETESYFREKHETGERNIDWYAGRQWTDDEIAAHEEQNREAYVFNEIHHKVEHIVGTQIQTRLDTRVVGRERGDADTADLLSSIVKWAEQINDVETIETEIFTESTLRGVSACQIRWEDEDVNYGYPKIERIPVREVYWDSQSKTHTMEDCRYMGRVMSMSKIEAAENYPKHLSLIDEALLSYTEYDLYVVPSYRELQNYRRDGLWYNNEGRDLIRIIEHYEKIKIYEYVVVDNIKSENTKFYNRKEAENYFAGLIEAYSHSGYIIANPDGSQEVYIGTTTIPRVMQTIIIGDRVAEHNLTALPFLPYCLNFCYYNEGDFWAFVDNLIKPQRMVNRLFSQWDFAVGTSMKNLITVMPSLLGKNFFFDDFVRESSQTAPRVPVISHEAIRTHPQAQIQPELFQGIGFGIERMNDYAGGRNALGFQESAAESGKAVQQRAQLAGMARLPMFDKLKSWRKQLTYKLVWWIINYMPKEQVIRIIGDNGDVKYMEMDNYIFDTLRELKYDVIIDETSKTETIRERNYEQLIKLFQTIPSLPSDVMLSMLLPFSTIPTAQRNEVMQQLKFYQGYMEQQAQAQAQQKLQGEVQSSLEKRKLKEDMIMQNEQLRTQEDLKKVNREVQLQNKIQAGIEKEQADIQKNSV